MNCLQSPSLLAQAAAKPLAKDFPWPQRDVKSVIVVYSLAKQGQCTVGQKGGK